jgi:hypothetical protein
MARFAVLSMAGDKANDVDVIWLAMMEATPVPGFQEFGRSAADE